MCNCIIVNIASIQGYIDKSKKFLHLANSSLIMSDLMRYIGLKQNFGDLIIPHIDTKFHIYKENESNSGYIQAFPNTIVIKSEKRIDNLNSQVNDLKEKFFAEIINKEEKFKNFSEDIKEDMKKEIFDIPEIYTAQGEGEDYKSAYYKAINLLEARKNTRLFEDKRDISSNTRFYNKKFEKIKIDPNKARVCSLCGENIGKIIEYSQSENHKKDTKIKGLCFSCYFKRYYPNKNEKSYLRGNDSYPSLTEIALEPWIYRNKDIIKNSLKMLNDIIKKSDEDILFKTNNDIKYLDDFTKKEEKVLSKIKKLKGEQSEYYAFIKADIDNLGKWISGKYYDKKDFLGYQKEITIIISEFTKKVLNDLNDKCHFVYAGGDDFLILSSIDNSIEVVEKLYKDIENIQNKYKNSPNLKGVFCERKITISTAVVFAHHKAPLDFVLNMVRKNLEYVKKDYDYLINDNDMLKSGLSLTYLTGGAKQITYTCVYSEKIIEDIKELINYFVCGLSRSIAIDIKNEIMPLICRDSKVRDLDIILGYIKRILIKKDGILKEDKNQEGQKNNELIEKIFRILKRTLMIKPKEINEDAIEVYNLLNLLEICKFISSKIQKEGIKGE